MNKEQIEIEALNLSTDQRAELIQNLLLSIDEDSEGEILDEWIKEAKTRAKQLYSGAVQAIPAEEVRKKARALLR
jgi:putative addiction module component (TIGR02574 family)